MNLAIFTGRLTADPELKTTAAGGVSVCRFTLAVDRAYAKDGEKVTDFINCVAWRYNAEFLAKYFKKGQMALVRGEMQNRSYEDKEGNTRYITELIADRVEFCGSKAGNEETKAAAESMPTMEDMAGFMPMPADDDLPF